MYRCLELALLAAGNTAPNPMVGAVLVHENRIIGEGYHQQFGEPHAEVNCIRSVPSELRHLIPFSTLYVSLEPCSHFGKTPPCTNLILEEKIPEVIIGSIDPSEKVNGKGVEILKTAGVKVTTGVLKKECDRLNRRFFTVNIQKRPYIILKWAQSANGLIGFRHGPVRLSDPLTDRLVHRWRAEESAIMVGTNTALIDNPKLTNRYWDKKGKYNHPVRVVLDLELRLPSTLHLFDGSVPTIVLNKKMNEEKDSIAYCKLNGNGAELKQSMDILSSGSVLHQSMEILYTKNISSLIVEGGQQLIQGFIDEDLWDEARVINNNQFLPYNSDQQVVHAPSLHQAFMERSEKIGPDTIQYFVHSNQLP